MAISNLKAEVDGNGYFTFAMNTNPVVRGYFKLSRTDGGTYNFNGTNLTTSDWLQAQNWAQPLNTPAGTDPVPTSYTINGTTYNNVSPFSSLSDGEYSLSGVEVLTNGQNTTGSSFYNFVVGNANPPGQTTTISGIAVIGRPFRGDTCIWTARSTSIEPVQFELFLIGGTIDPALAGRKPSVGGATFSAGGNTYPQYFNYGGLPNGNYKLVTYNSSGVKLDEWDFTGDCAPINGTTTTVNVGTTTTQNTISIGRVFGDNNCVQIARSTFASQVLFQLLGRNGSTVPSNLQGQKQSVTNNPVVVLGNLTYRQEFIYGTLTNGSYTINTFNGATQIDSFDFDINCNATATTTIPGTTTTVGGSTTTVLSQTIGRVFLEGVNRVARTNNAGNVTFTLTGRNGTSIPLGLIGAKTATVTNPPLTNGSVTYTKEFNYGQLVNGDYTIKVFSSAGQQLDTFDFTISGSNVTTTVSNVTTTVGTTTTVPGQTTTVNNTTTVNQTTTVNTGGVNSDVNMTSVGRLTFSCSNNQMNILATFKALTIIPLGTTIAITSVNLPNGTLSCSAGNIIDNILTFTRTVGVNETFTVSSYFIANCQKPINNAQICLVI